MLHRLSPSEAASCPPAHGEAHHNPSPAVRNLSNPTRALTSDSPPGLPPFPRGNAGRRPMYHHRQSSTKAPNAFINAKLTLHSCSFFFCEQGFNPQTCSFWLAFLCAYVCSVCVWCMCVCLRCVCVCLWCLCVCLRCGCGCVCMCMFVECVCGVCVCVCWCGLRT